MKWLVSWIGDNDVKAAAGEPAQGEGPVADFLRTASFDRVVLIHNRMVDATRFQVWLQMTLQVRAEVLEVTLPRPHDFDDVYAKTLAVLDQLAARDEGFRNGHKTYLLSPGTKAMSTALLLIGCTSFRGELHANWLDPAEPDPRRRTARLNWPETFGLALWPLGDRQPPLGEVFRDAEGLEITQLASVREVYTRAARVARSEAPVLILGETGTGKELLAGWLHNQGPRAKKPFQVVNCGAIPPTLIDSHLFGHVRGAFTGAVAESRGVIGSADGGTLFLDEIGELPVETQARLLRFLQEGEIYRVGAARPESVDVRVVAATHRDLRQLVREDQFRADLYFRLAHYALKLPPLRDRLEDLPLLCDAVVNRWQERHGNSIRIDQGAARALRAYAWPGNIRELQGILTRCLVDARSGPGGEHLIDRSLVALAIDEQGLGTPASATPGIDWAGPVLGRILEAARPYRESLRELEATIIGRALAQFPSRAEAARRLGMTPQNLNAKLKNLQHHGLRL